MMRVALIVMLATATTMHSASGLAVSQPAAEARTITPATGRIVRLPGEPPCFVSIDAWLPGTWSEPAYETQETSPGSYFDFPDSTRVTNGQRDDSGAARTDIDRVVYALETALAFSEDMVAKTRAACQELGSWLSVRLVRDDPDVNGGMYRSDTNTIFLDLADLDGERYVSVDASPKDADLANRLAKSQNIRTTLAHEIDHARGAGHDDPIPEQQHIFVGAPGLDENRVMEDLGFPLRRVAYGSSDGVPYEAFGTRIYLRSTPAVSRASGDREAQRMEPDATAAIELLTNKAFEIVLSMADSDSDGLPDRIDPCPDKFSPTQRTGCESAPEEPPSATPIADAFSTSWSPIGDGPSDPNFGREYDLSFWEPASFYRFAQRNSPLVDYMSFARIESVRIGDIYAAKPREGDQSQPAIIPQVYLPVIFKQGERGAALPFAELRIVFARTVGDFFARSTLARRQGPNADVRVVPRPSVKLLFTSLGQSTGDAIRMIAINDGDVPVRLQSEGVLLEPVEGVTPADIQRELRALDGKPRVEVNLKAYCRDMQRNIPPAGTLMRLASDQGELGPIQRAFAAARRLVDQGELRPDVDRDLYVDSIRQWSLWTLRERFDERGFVAAFVDHTKKNVAAAGRRWQDQYQREARELAVTRWRAVQRVLTESRAQL